MNNTYPIVYTIAGSDSSGGAGAQADLKVFSKLNTHGCSIITVVTAQNTQGVNDAIFLSNEIIESQCDSLIHDLPPNALKISMVGNALELLIKKLIYLKKPTIFDPVIDSSSKYNFINKKKLSKIKSHLLPLCSLVTPNLPEAKKLVGHDRYTIEDIAKYIIDFGSGAVLIKGGHAEDAICKDFFYDGKNKFYLESPRLKNTMFHGTGCVLSAAITSYIALGESLTDAIILAKAYLNQLLNNSPEIGNGDRLISIQVPCNDSQYKPNIVCFD